MIDEQQHDPLQEALAALPPTTASDGFTDRVLQRAARPARRPGAAPFALAAATVVGAAVAVTFLIGTPAEPESSATSNPAMARLDATPTPAPRPTVPATRAIAPARDAGMVTAASIHGGVQDAYRLLDELKAEHRRARAEWRALARLARDNEPILYLGGNDSTDLVLDLRDLPPAGARLTVTPAAARRVSERTY